jgi:hypothetical protein
MIKSKISPNINPEATFVFQRSNSVVVFSNPISMPINTTKIREGQERLLMENKGEDHQKNEAELFLDENISVKENHLPRSCFTIFKDGLINNLMEMVKCIGAKR